jgi:adenosylhomocysteine nucleosidase
MSGAARPRSVFIAALRREVAALLSAGDWKSNPGFVSRGIDLYASEDAVVAFAGMGAHRAALAVEAALSLGPVSELISVGFAGACSPAIQAGEIIRASVVIDSRTGERFFTDIPRTGSSETEIPQVVVTVPAPAGVLEKDRLARSYEASAVEMEAATVGRIASARELPFYAIKAISDEANFELPDMSRFVTSQGQLREAAFGLHVAFHPRLWKSVLTMAKSSKLAAGHLHTAMTEHLQQHRNTKP